MFVRVRLDFVGWYGHREKSDFWRTFEALRLNKDSPEGFERFDPSIANEYEGRFVDGFSSSLEALVNKEISDAWSDRSDGRSAALPKVKIRLLTVEYGSIKAVLDILGVENSDFRDFVLLALEIYSPLAFRQALNSDVMVTASVVTVGGEPPVRANSDVITTRTTDALNRAWIISNTTLLVPVFLALAVLYYAFNGLAHEMEGVRSQASELRMERVEIVKALIDQNKSISTSIVDHAKQSAANDKSMSDVLISILKLKSAEILAPPAKP